mmetsp:Transcript_28170/g.70706  ORF Transcript_28170/g.70706 Transcript_28170/m.70706 type:complete len:273 (+) Transcript_28170:2475-3293(+)
MLALPSTMSRKRSGSSSSFCGSLFAETLVLDAEELGSGSNRDLMSRCSCAVSPFSASKGCEVELGAEAEAEATSAVVCPPDSGTAWESFEEGGFRSNSDAMLGEELLLVLLLLLTGMAASLLAAALVDEVSVVVGWVTEDEQEETSELLFDPCSVSLSQSSSSSQSLFQSEPSHPSVPCDPDTEMVDSSATTVVTAVRAADVVRDPLVRSSATAPTTSVATSAMLDTADEIHPPHDDQPPPPPPPPSFPSAMMLCADYCYCLFVVSQRNRWL